MDDLIRKYEVFKGNSVFEEDASYDAFAGLYLPVYSKIKVFSENSDALVRKLNIRASIK